MTQIDLADSLITGTLGVFHLKRLWSRCLRERSGLRENRQDADEWRLDCVIYHGLNLPIEETIRIVYQQAPSFEEFEDWVLSQNGGSIARNTVERINATIAGIVSGETHVTRDPIDPILTDDDLEFWNDSGYLVISDLYDSNEVLEAERAVWNYLGMDPEDPDSWYELSSGHGIMIQLFHHPALEVIRRSAKLKRVFAQLWGTTDLWISTDRVSFNPPERSTYKFPGPHLHWDVSLELPIPFGLQGLVYLTETLPEQGAFTCVPGFHNRIDSWMQSLPAGADPRNQDLAALGAIPIAGKAGDVVVWHQALPHGSSPNRAKRPRIVEYVTMFPATASYADDWK